MFVIYAEIQIAGKGRQRVTNHSLLRHSSSERAGSSVQPFLLISMARHLSRLVFLLLRPFHSLLLTLSLPCSALNSEPPLSSFPSLARLSTLPSLYASSPSGAYSSGSPKVNGMVLRMAGVSTASSLYGSLFLPTSLLRASYA